MLGVELDIAWSIISKLFMGMVGILFFLRFAGKIQMATMTPLDSVNIIVLGALVGSIIYMPDMSVWVMVFGILVWTLLNMGVRWFLRRNAFRNLVYGRDEMLMRNGKLNIEVLKHNHLDMEQLRTKLREQNVYSLFDVKEVRFEIDGELTIFKDKKGEDSYLLVNNGEVIDDALAEAKRSREWLDEKLSSLGFNNVGDVFAAEWTPQYGLYVIGNDGKVFNKKDT